MSNTAPYTLGPIYLVNFFGTFGFSIVFPFLVFLNIEFGGDSLLFGILLASYSLFQIPGAFILGRLSDRIGRKKVLIISHIGTICSWLVYILALLVPIIPLYSVDSQFTSFVITLPLVLLFTARGLDGLTGGNIAVANAYLVDVSTKSNLTARLGKNALAADLGLVIGPIIGGTLGSILSGSESAKAFLPAIAALVISLAAVFILFRLRESPMFSKENLQKIATRTIKPKFVDVLAVKGVLAIMCIFFMLIFTLGLFITVLPLHTQIDLGWSSIDVAIFFAIIGISLIITEGPILSKISNKISDKKISLLGFGILSIGCLMFTFEDLPYGYFVSAIPFSVGIGLSATALHAYVTKLVSASLQGTLQGSMGTIDAAGAVTGLVLGGFLFEMIGAYGVYYVLSIIIALLIPVSLYSMRHDVKNDS